MCFGLYFQGFCDLFVIGANINEKLGTVWKELQANVDGILDKNMTMSKSVGGWGLKQLIEHKEGLFRMNMMGKR